MKITKMANLYQTLKPRINNFFKFGVSASSDVQESFHYHLKPTLCLLRILGAFPVVFDPSVSGLAKFKFVSPITAYTMCFYIATNALSWTLITDFFHEIKKFDGDLSETMYTAMFISFLSYNVWFPFLAWLDVRRTCQYFEKWVEFQKEFVTVTKERMQLDMRKHSFRTVIAVSTASQFAAGMSYALTKGSSGLWKAPAFMVSAIYFVNTVLLKLFMFLALNKAGTALLNTFKSDLDKKSLSPNLIDGYRLLWLRWSRLVSEEEFMFGSVYAFFFLKMSFLVMIHMYCFLVDLKSGKTDVQRLYNTVPPCIFGTFNLFAMCRNAHALSDLGRKFQKHLELIVPSTVSVSTWTEVKYFLRTIKMNPAVVSALGFTKVDKSLFMALMSTIVTYMIVLLQFDEGNSNSRTPTQNSSSAMYIG